MHRGWWSRWRKTIGIETLDVFDHPGAAVVIEALGVLIGEGDASAVEVGGGVGIASGLGDQGAAFKPVDDVGEAALELVARGLCLVETAGFDEGHDAVGQLVEAIVVPQENGRGVGGRARIRLMQREAALFVLGAAATRARSISADFLSHGERGKRIGIFARSVMTLETDSVTEAEVIAQRWARYYETVEKPRDCIECDDGRVGWNGRRKRSASLVAADELVHVAQMWCRRVKCTRCGTSWTLRPPGLVPHKHYQLCVVARATSEYLWGEHSTLTAVAAAHGCARRTVKRWVCWLAAIADPAALLSKLREAVDAPVVPRASRVAQLVRKARYALGRVVLERAAEVLALCEALGSAWGLEPPGLRAVVERVVANRSGIATYARPLIPELARSHPR